MVNPAAFFALVFALTIPLLLVGAHAGVQLMPGLPLAAFNVMCPLVAALLLSGARGSVALLARAVDWRRIPLLSYIPILLFMPAVTALSYLIIRPPAPQISVLSTLGLCAVFLVAAACEELGWTGYALDPMQARLGALNASIVLGIIWAAFHFVALWEAHRTLAWIAWWSLGTVALRVVMVSIYNHAGRSVLAMILFHTTINLCWQLFPIRGSYFDPRIGSLITVAAAVCLLTGAFIRRATSGAWDAGRT